MSELDGIAANMERKFQEGRRLLSFQQYLELFAADPVRYGRDAANYVRDMFDNFGTRVVAKPWGEVTRWNLFDLAWEPAPGAAPGEAAQASLVSHGRDGALVGQEELQAEIYRCLANFAREGRANRLVLMHGPNGSAKSTVAACLMRALEHYSSENEGALYRFPGCSRANVPCAERSALAVRTTRTGTPTATLA